MPESNMFPISDYGCKIISKRLNIPLESCRTLENFRRFYDSVDVSCKLNATYKKEILIEFNNYKVKLFVYRPLGSEKEILPAIFFIHGGGWFSCSHKNYNGFADSLVSEANACFFLVEYSFSPEVKHPVALEECYATICWIQQNAELLKVDISRMAFCGDSTGGNMATVLALLAKNRGNLGASQQVLIYPVTDTDFHTESYKDSKNNVLGIREIAMQYFENHIRSKDDLQSVLLAPYKNTLQELKKLPTTMIITADIDVYRSDGLKYAKKLKEAGVKVNLFELPFTLHGYVSSISYETSSKRSKAIQTIAEWLRIQWSTSSKL